MSLDRLALQRYRVMRRVAYEWLKVMANAAGPTVNREYLLKTHREKYITRAIERHADSFRAEADRRMAFERDMAYIRIWR